MIKKLLTYSVVITTVVWSVGLLATPLAVGAAVSGDLIKKANSPAVYYLGADSKLYVFPSAEVYKTWYSDFSGVKLVSDTEFAGYFDNGVGNVFVRPGSGLVQAVDGETPWNIVDSKVYAVSGDNTLRHIGSAEVAAEIFGAGWEGLIVPVVLSVFTQYGSGADLVVAGDYDKDAETTDSASINVVKGLSSDGNGGTVSTGTGLTVALAADTPATGIVVSNAARVPFTKINLTASADGDIIIDQMVVQRAGLGNDLAFSSIDILDASTMLPINNFSKTLGSTHQATFNDNLTVPAGTTKSIIIAGNMGSLLSYAGEAPVLQLAGITLTGSAAVIGTLPINGNYQSTNGTITIGTVTVSDGNNNPSASTQNVGTTNYIVSSIKLTAGSAEDVTLKSITFTQNGSASLADLENVRLVKSNTGEVLGSLATLTSDKFSFALNETLQKGKNVSLDIKADIASGSGRDISIDIDQTTDVVVSGNTYGYNITPSYTTTGNGSTPEYDAANTTVGNGNLTIQSATVSPTNIAEDQSQVTIGKLKFIAKGEAVNITSIGWRVNVATSSGTDSAYLSDVTNVTVYNENGDAVAGPIDLTENPDVVVGSDTGTATTTDTITVPVGETVYTVKADLSEDFTTNDLIQVSIAPGSITCKGDTTGNTITPTPAGIVSSTSLTLKAGALATSVSSDPAAQSVVVGSKNFTFSKFILSATDSGKDMVITQIQLKTTTAGTAYPDLVTNIKLYDGSTEIVPNNYPGSIAYSTAGTTATGSATTTYLFDVGDFVIPAGTSKTIVAKADIGSGPTIAGNDDTLALGLQSSAMSVQDDQGNSVTAEMTGGAGQAHILQAAGEVLITAKTSPADGLAIGGSTDVVGKFILKAKYEDLNVNKLEFNYADAGGSGIAGDKDDIVSLTLYQDGVATALGTASVEGANTTITPATTLVIAKDQEVSFTLYATWAAIDDTTSAESGSGVQFNLANVEVSSPQSGGTVTKTGQGAAFKSFSVYKSIPTVTQLAGGATITGYQATNIAKVKVTADAAGPIGLYKLSFLVTTTTVGLDSDGYYIYESNSESVLGNLIGSASATAANSDIVVASGGEGNNIDFLQVYFDISNDSTARAEEQLMIDAGTSKYLTLRGTPKSGHDSTGGNEAISVSIGGDATFASTTATRAGSNEGVDCLSAGAGATCETAKDFIWSDLIAEQYSTSTATVHKMWHNGYLVPGLGSGATTTSMVVTD